MTSHRMILESLHIGFAIGGATIGILMILGVLPVAMTIDRALTSLLFGSGPYAPERTTLRAMDIALGSGLVALAIGGIVGAVGLMKARRWGRGVLWGVGVVQIFLIPVGTVIAVCTFILLSHQAKRSHTDDFA